MIKGKGRLFVISAPSGAGKTTLLKGVMSRVPGLVFSISHTTRSPRIGETDGVEYHFVDREQFLEMVEQNMFLEHAQVHDNFYGTSRMAVGRLLECGTDVVLDIDVQGADILRHDGILKAAYIFVSPPGIDELEKRLRGRGTESDERVALRLKNAKIEMQAAPLYDYLIVNDVLAEAIDLLVAIILAERAKMHRLPSGEPIGDRAI